MSGRVSHSIYVKTDFWRQNARVGHKLFARNAQTNNVQRVLIAFVSAEPLFGKSNLSSTVFAADESYAIRLRNARATFGAKKRGGRPHVRTHAHIHSRHMTRRVSTRNFLAPNGSAVLIKRQKEPPAH